MWRLEFVYLRLEFNSRHSSCNIILLELRLCVQPYIIILGTTDLKKGKNLLVFASVQAHWMLLAVIIWSTYEISMKLKKLQLSSARAALNSQLHRESWMGDNSPARTGTDNAAVAILLFQQLCKSKLGNRSRFSGSQKEKKKHQKRAKVHFITETCSHFCIWNELPKER